MNLQTKPNATGSALEPMLRKLEYWQKFDAEDRAALLALSHKVKSLEANHYIVRESTRPPTAASC